MAKTKWAAKWAATAAAALALTMSAGSAKAQTIGYAQAIDRLAASCGKDIAKFCKTAPLGGGRVTQCLSQHAGSVSSTCKNSVTVMTSLLKTRAQARADVPRVCDADIKRLCAGVQAGDGNLMECFYKAQSRVSQACQIAVTNAGYTVSTSANTSTSQVALSSNDLINSLQGLEGTKQNLTAVRLRQMAAQGIKDPSRANRVNRPPLTDLLGNLAQLTIAVQFEFDSARISPSSFQAVGLMADALNHPYLQGYRFLIVGHTDGKGNREYNLKLSQQRADAIRDALINPFGIPSSRIDAVGLGEEQFLTPANPEAAENRRVQLINIGPASPPPRRDSVQGVN